MNIVQLLLAPLQGGAESLAEELNKEWRDRGHGSTIVYLRGGDRRGRIDQCWNVRRQTVARKADVLVCHTFLPNAYGRLSVLARGRRVRVVVVLHSAADDYAALRARLLERLLLLRTDAVVAVSGQRLIDYGKYFPRASRNLVLIPNGVGRAFCSKGFYRSRPTRFVTLSRIAPSKDILTLIAGFGLFTSTADSSPTLQIAGQFDSAEYLNAVRQRIQAMGLASQVTLLGAVSDVPRLLRDSDCLIHAAVQEVGPDPLAVLEAEATGLPVISSAFQGSPDQPSTDRVLFGVGNAQELADAIRLVDADYAGRARVASRRAASVRRDSDVATEYLRLFSTLDRGA